MFSRIRIALGLALLFTFFTYNTVFAKGDFSFIAVTGGTLRDEVRLSDPALTHDFFTFADFYDNKTEAPLDPGMGYEIIRYYMNGHTETAFDRLHYYPETGFVYYDGIVNGSSEYDGKWYIAQPEIKGTFETALFTQLRLMGLGTQEGSQALVPPAEPVQAIDSAQESALIPQIRSLLPIIVSVGLMFMLVAAFDWLRRFLHTN